MDYIILDIEFNGRKFASELPMEVIEIGAIRLDSSLQPKDEFSSLIKPVYFSKLNDFIRKKTGIPQEAIDQAPGFPAVIKDFTDWLQRSDAFRLVTWGGEDIKRIVLDTRMHKLDDSSWLAVQYFDLLKGYIRYKNVKNDVSVEAALLDLGIASTASAHRALDDARMTAEIFRAIYDKLDTEERLQQFKDVYSNAKERRAVKHAVRAMIARNIVPTWELLVEHYFKDKAALADPKKLKELQAFFAAEADKAKPARRKNSANIQTGNP